MHKPSNTPISTWVVIAALFVAAAASPNLPSAGDVINSDMQYSRKLLKVTDDAEAPSPAEALAPVILTFMGIDDNSTESAGNGTAGSQGRGDGHGDGGRPYPPGDYCGSIHCPPYPHAVPVPGDVAAANSPAGSGAAFNNVNGTAIGAPGSPRQQGFAEQPKGSVTSFQGLRDP